MYAGPHVVGVVAAQPVMSFVDDPYRVIGCVPGGHDRGQPLVVRTATVIRLVRVLGFGLLEQIDASGCVGVGPPEGDQVAQGVRSLVSTQVGGLDEQLARRRTARQKEELQQAMRGVVSGDARRRSPRLARSTGERGLEQRHKTRRRLDAELVRERDGSQLVHGTAFEIAVLPAVGLHQLGVRPFSQRSGRHRLLQLVYRVVDRAEHHRDLSQVIGGAIVEIVQPLPVGGGAGMFGQVVIGLVPQIDGGGQQAVRRSKVASQQRRRCPTDPGVEPHDIDVDQIGGQHVTVGNRFDDVRGAVLPNR